MASAHAWKPEEVERCSELVGRKAERYWAPRLSGQAVANYGLPPSARLRHPREFRAVFSKKQKTSDRFFVVYFLKNSLDRSRVGITVSRKVSTRAVKRNRVKRLIRESFRTYQFSGDGLDIVVIAQRATTLASNQEIISSLEKHWTRVSDKCKKI